MSLATRGNESVLEDMKEVRPLLLHLHLLYLPASFSTFTSSIFQPPSPPSPPLSSSLLLHLHTPLSSSPPSPPSPPLSSSFLLHLHLLYLLVSFFSSSTSSIFQSPPPSSSPGDITRLSSSSTVLTNPHLTPSLTPQEHSKTLNRMDYVCTTRNLTSLSLGQA
ncbi:hypothetical protein Pmani_034752 [Petrolisthes manimaculis]|uniref:Uncharacterized protein n=1 Tax=Petrolisthes manimaculis TaxID=1843537 RepID=A0AAE1NNQ1_9EUCA|nr:hypothetical protein Pmani_034752 [Petrolisthes manimaculis]